MSTICFKGVCRKYNSTRYWTCSIFERTRYNIVFENHTFFLTYSLSSHLIENTIGKKIKKLRISLGLTQSEFGNKLNRALTTIANWENGHRVPPKYILNNIINLYDLDKSYFNI
ncbi:helix-turn-helix transcriptional regulator [Clostridium sp. LS]|uniref:helix-turn-helix domain-containing protein n=1 Tax=Clostridium sp. Maddingley MBC34-26 TaxID=1196322 RepID=UPI000C1973F4